MPGKALKVFQAHLGFFDTVVAVPSKKAALEAWGSSQDLFHTGLASVATDKAAIAAALSKPGVVLKRPAGSNDPFTAEPRLPTIKTGPRKPSPAKHSPPPPRPPAREPKPPPPDRSELDGAEKALDALKREIELSEADFARRRKELAGEEQQAKSKFRTRERELTQRLAAAKHTYSRALRKQGR